MFSDAQLAAIHEASLRRLGETGVHLEDPDTIGALLQAGCTTDGAGLVKLSPDLVARALAEVPREVSLYSRGGGVEMRLGDGKLHVGTGLDWPNTMDLVGSERRKALLADVTAFGRLCEALENLDCATSMCGGQSEEVEMWQRQAFLGLLESTTKPIVCSVHSASAMRDTVRMAEIAMGGAAALVARPFLMACVVPAASQGLSGEDMALIRGLADQGIPWVFDAGLAPADEKSGPLDARLVVANTRALSVLAIAQVRRPGSPIILGTATSPDPAEVRWGHCLTELLSRRYRLPFWGAAGVSDSKLPDIQAGIESALSLQAAAQRGTSLALGVGSLESGAMGSFEMVVIADEIVGYLRQLADGDPARRPSLFDRDAHPVWIESGRANMIRGAREKAIEIVGTNLPPVMPESTLAELQEFVALADADTELEH